MKKRSLFSRLTMVVAILAALALGLAVQREESAAFVPLVPESPLLPSLIPGDALGYVAFKNGELWKSPSGREILKFWNAISDKDRAKFEEEMGVSPLAIEYAGVIVMDLEHEPLLYLLASKKVNQETIRKNMAGDIKKKTANNKEYFVGTIRSAAFNSNGKVEATVDSDGPDVPALHFFDDKSFVAGPAGPLKKYLERNPKTLGGLSGTFEEAGKHPISAAFDVARLGAKGLPGLPEDFKPLLEAKLITVTLDVDAPWKLDMEIRFQNETSARKAQMSARTAYQLALAQVTVLKGQLRSVSVPLFGRPLEQALTSLKQSAIKQNGANLELHVASPIQIKVDREVLDGLQQASARTESSQHLRQLMLGMHNFADRDGFPPSALCDKQGKPLLSWRVLLLPYLEHEKLYKQFKLDEPWDSEHNKKLLASMPDIYKTPGTRDEEGMTRYAVITGPSTAYPGKPGKYGNGMALLGSRFTDIVDGLTQTIGLVEAAAPIPWTKPADVDYDPKKPVPKFYVREGRYLVAIMDGSVRTVSKDIKARTLQLAIEPGDGNVLPADWDE
ncbi:MAG: DUF1559 domain-containing protein [Gemmataceae bacterium]